MRWLLWLLVACSSRVDRTGDPAVGRWTGDNHRIFELRADGTLDIDPIADRGCENAPALTACRARQTWSRAGNIITFERAALAHVATNEVCECHLEREQIQLRGDELVSGKEHATRVQ